MSWEMSPDGSWNTTSGSGDSGLSDSSERNNIDKGNTADTNSAIKETTSNKEDAIKYAEEANFTTDGNYAIKRGGKLLIGDGVASRWQGEWLILSTTHTVDNRGYKVEGVLGRIPYKEETKKKKAASTTSEEQAKKEDVKSSDKSAGKWEMNSSGVWKLVGD